MGSSGADLLTIGYEESRKKDVQVSLDPDGARSSTPYPSARSHQNRPAPPDQTKDSLLSQRGVCGKASKKSTRSCRRRTLGGGTEGARGYGYGT